MKVLLVGGGGREHALAWKLAKSPLLRELVWAPGNAASVPGVRREDISAEDVPALVALASALPADLVVVGPEVPLAGGIADRLAEARIPCFGPSAAAARLESSKSFSKAFCARHGIPTALGSVFREIGPAEAFLRAHSFRTPLVLKADGLAAGKGVLICPTLEEALSGMRDILVERQFGAAGDTVVVEEFLEGEEASLLAFSDGARVVVMPPARDHKKALDGDMGPNTGGMGAYCPSGHLTEGQVDDLRESVLQRVVDGCVAEGHPFRGVLYAGLMLTQSGPRVLEFNCRFGDPETQVVLPRLEDDLLPILLASAEGDLGGITPRWSPEVALTVALCSGGYPGSYSRGHRMTGVESAGEVSGVTVFHAGTAVRDGALVTAGGRVLNVTALAPTLAGARERAYEAVHRISFQGMHYRTDIGPAEALG